MAENYIAFISYRHKPLDSLVAARLHRMIEHYRIQRELRHGDMKYPGRVFRDRDELPLSSDLTAELRGALDHSEFLIVVCTPDTPGSIWVDREIEYFLRNHDRGNVLAVLAAGTQEQSFPKRLTEVYGSDGVTVIDQVEPLAANVSDDTTPARWTDRLLSQRQRVTGRLRSEFLRLMAAILRCPYDALRQRQKQYRQRRTMAAFGAVAFVALAFVIMLLDRNRQIREQMELARANEQRALAGEQLALENEKRAQENARQAQSNESYALALLSEQQLADGNRSAALQSALAALPVGDVDRPYRVEAEKALADALYVYQPEGLRQVSRMEQITDIEDMVLSADGTRLITRDVNDILRCFDTVSRALLWEQDAALHLPEIVAVLDEEDAVIVVKYDKIKRFCLDNGELLAEYVLQNDHHDWKQNRIEELILSPDQTEIVELLTPKEPDGEVFLVFFDVSSGQERMTVSLGTFLREGDSVYITGELQISENGENWLVQLSASNREELTEHASVFVGETEDGTVLSQLSWELPYISRITSTIGRNRLVIIRHLSDSIWVECYLAGTWKQEYCNEIALSEEWRFDLNERLCVGENWNFWWCYGRALYTLDIIDGSVKTHQPLSEEALATRTVTGGTTGELYLILKDGSIVCSNDLYADSTDPLPVMGEFSFALSKAIIDQSNTLFCGIPADEPGTVVCIRPVQDTHFEKFNIVTPSEFSRLRYVYQLPNGKEVRTISDSYEAYVEVRSSSHLSERYVFSDYINSEKIETFCRKGDTLLFGGLRPIALDMEEDLDWPISALLPQEYQDSYLTRRASAPIADNGNGLIVWDDYENNQVFVWDDMRSVHSISYDGQGKSITGAIAVGNNGWIVMGVKKDDGQKHFIACNVAEESWRSIVNSNVASEEGKFCAADSQPWVAAMGDDSICRILDLTTGGVVWEKYLPATAEMVEEIRFSQEDSLLLVRLQHEILYLISLDKEDEWHTFVLQDWSDESYGSQLIIQADKTGNALYVADSGGWMTGLCLDRETLQVKAEIPGLFCYVPETGQVLCRRIVGLEYGLEYVHEVYNIFSYPAYSLEDLIAQAQEILGIS